MYIEREQMTKCSTHTFHFFADPEPSWGLAVLLGETQTGLDLLGRLKSKRESINDGIYVTSVGIQGDNDDTCKSGNTSNWKLC